jgi:hypothetical protein|tara:strand:- start:30 stop:842 length:813 start_codon:yes stop_codon:yes gene_type:complete
MAEGIESLANPEDLEAARQASEAMADIEFMAEQQNILPERMRMSGDLGFFPAMGYQGDYPQTGEEAEIISFGMPNPQQRRRGLVPTIGIGGGTMGGLYLTKDSDSEAIGRKYGGIEAFEPFGMPKAGAVMFFNSPEYRAKLEKQQRRDRSGQEAVSETISHELLHRGAADVLPMAALAEFAQEKTGFFPSDADRAVKVFETMQFIDGQHSYTDALKNFQLARGDEEKLSGRDREKIKDLVSAGAVAREFFTPERQEEFQLRVPIQATEPR